MGINTLHTVPKNKTTIRKIGEILNKLYYRGYFYSYNEVNRLYRIDKRTFKKYVKKYCNIQTKTWWRKKLKMKERYKLFYDLPLKKAIFLLKEGERVDKDFINYIIK